MAYVIKRSDQSIFTIINDKTIDRESFALALVGRGAINYGTDFAENFVHLFENFASINPPVNPMLGTLWYNTDPDNPKLKIYTGTIWKSVDGDPTAANQPLTVVQRDSAGNFAATLVTANLDGLAESAKRLINPRRISLTGNATGNTTFDGTGDVVIQMAVNRSDAADRLTTPQSIAVSGDVIGHVSFDGTSPVALTTSLSETVGTPNAAPNALMRRNGEGNVAAINFYGSFKGVADEATRWQTPRTLTLSGDLSGSVQIDGSGNVTLASHVTDVPDSALNPTGVQPGAYTLTSITVDQYGRITSASSGSAGNGTAIANGGRADTAGTANRLTDGRSIALSGPVTGSTVFDGSTNVTINTTLSPTGVTARSYSSANIRVGADGRILEASDGSLGTGDGGNADYATRAGRADTAGRADSAGRADTAGTADAFSGVIGVGQIPKLTTWNAKYQGANIPSSGSSFPTTQDGIRAGTYVEACVIDYASTVGGTYAIYVSSGSGQVYSGAHIVWRVFHDATMIYQGLGSTPYNTGNGNVLNPEIFPFIDTNDVDGSTRFTVQIAMWGPYSIFNVVSFMRIVENRR